MTSKLQVMQAALKQKKLKAKQSSGMQVDGDGVQNSTNRVQVTPKSQKPNPNSVQGSGRTVQPSWDNPNDIKAKGKIKAHSALDYFKRSKK